MHTLVSQSEFHACSFLDWFLRDLFLFPHFYFFGTQELNSFNYLDLYRLADLFNLTLLEKAVIDFLVKHLSELLKSRPEDVLTLPYCLLQEVLKSDRLTSLSEEQIWQVRALRVGLVAWRGHEVIVMERTEERWWMFCLVWSSGSRGPLIGQWLENTSPQGLEASACSA